jgi:hypothetical protein
MKSKTSSIPRSCVNVYSISSSGKATQCQITHGSLRLILPTPKISLIHFTRSTPISLRLHCLLRRQHQEEEIDQSARSISSVLRLFFIRQIQFHQHSSELPHRNAFNFLFFGSSCIAICSTACSVTTWPGSEDLAPTEGEVLSWDASVPQRTALRLA